MKRVMDTASPPRGFADDQQVDVLIRVVDEGVGKSGARRKRNAGVGLEPLDVSVSPQIRFAFDHIDELFLIRFGMRP